MSVVSKSEMNLRWRHIGRRAKAEAAYRGLLRERRAGEAGAARRAHGWQHRAKK